MKRTGYKPRGITAARQIKTDLTVDEIHHPLGGCCLPHVALLPAETLQLFLILHQPQRTFAGNIFGVHLHHHTTIAPSRAATGWRHTVDHNLLRARGRRNNKATGTHTERINTTAIYLSDKGIFGCGQIIATAILIMILYLVNQLTGMLQTHTDGQALGLYLNTGLHQIAIDITSRMTRGEDDGTHESGMEHGTWSMKIAIFCRLSGFGLYTHHSAVCDDETCHPGLKMHLTT